MRHCTALALVPTVMVGLAGGAAADGPRTTSDQELRAFIEDLRECSYSRDDVTDRIAKAIEKHCERQKDHLYEYGALKSVRFLGAHQRRRADMYLVEFENHYVVWLIGRTGSGEKIRYYRYLRL